MSGEDERISMLASVIWGGLWTPAVVRSESWDDDDEEEEEDEDEEGDEVLSLPKRRSSGGRSEICEIHVIERRIAVRR